MIAPTVKEWLSLMPLVADRGWREEGVHGAIRDADERCPICSVVNEISGGDVDLCLLAHTAAEKLGLSPNAATAIGVIVLAADQITAPRRAAIERALGMIR